MIGLRKLFRLELIFGLLFALSFPLNSYCRDLSTPEQNNKEDIVTKWTELIAKKNEFVKEEKYKEAIVVLEESLKLTEKNFGSNSFLFAASLSSLGDVYFIMGLMGEAEKFYKQSIEIYESLPLNLSYEKTLLWGEVSARNLRRSYETKSRGRHRKSRLIQQLSLRLTQTQL